MLITSYIDENYYIFETINRLEICRTALKLFNKEYYELSALLITNLEIFTELKDKLFIDKNSELGKVITLLIKEDIIIDQKNMLTEEIVFYALKYVIQNEKYNNLFPILIELIKKEKFGVFNWLSPEYNLEDLKLINKIGNYQKEKNFHNQLTGFEETGLTFNKDNNLSEFNINTKETKQLPSIEEIRINKKIKKHQKSN